MTLRIDPVVFNSAKAREELSIEALHTASEAQEFTEYLIQAANETFEDDKTPFALITLTSTHPDALETFAMLSAQEADGDTPASAKILDLSFGMFKDPNYILRAACQVRHDTKMPEAGKFERHPKPDKLVASDSPIQLSSEIFSWVDQALHKDKRSAFHQKCEELGLVQIKNTIGFTADLRGSLPAPPSQEQGIEAAIH